MTESESVKKVVLYTRVSSDAQAEVGFSLAQQLLALREHAARKDYKVVAEISDPGHSGASLLRPGLDKLRAMVADGGVDVVLVQDRDRLSREIVHVGLLKIEFEATGTVLIALNSRGGDTPEDALTDGVQDLIAQYERHKIAQRTLRGRLQRTREGKIVPGRTPDYGFHFSPDRTSYEVDPATMPVMHRIFRLMGEEGASINGVRKTFAAEGITPPRGGRWEREFVRSKIEDDVYLAHGHEELEGLVAEGVLAQSVLDRLDPSRRYGVWWYNQRSVKRTKVTEDGPEGRRYRERSAVAMRPREEWIAVPVVDSGIPRELVEAARRAIKDNVPFSAAGGRDWQLSGLVRCGGCGRRMHNRTTRAGRNLTLYSYYQCGTRRQYGPDACPIGPSHRATAAEEGVWGLVRDLLSDPAKLRERLDAMLDAEREATHGDPEAETEALVKRLGLLDAQRGRAQDLAVEGLLSPAELKAKLSALEAQRRAAAEELARVRGRRERLEQLERDRDALLDHYAALTPEALDSLNGEERHALYRLLRITVEAGPDGTLTVRGVFGTDGFGTDDVTSPRSPRSSTSGGSP